MSISYAPLNRFISIDGIFISIQAIAYVKKHEDGDVEIFLIAEPKPLVFSGNNAENLIEFLESNSDSIQN
jgi:hypothetical protein